MRFLVSAKWIEGEASRRRISPTEAEIMAAFRQAKDESFPTEKAYQRFLKRSGQTQQDVLYRVKLDVLSNKIRDDVLRGESGRAAQKLIDSFSASFRRRWKSKTKCRDGFVVAYCRSGS